MNVVDTTTAAKMLGRTRDGIAWMCKDERPQCSRVGGRWVTELTLLADYQACRPHTGGVNTQTARPKHSG